ncbi:MAG TPA: NYN domain-containing protein, partial [Desulfobacterales bacterium]|nr:NYN domain-containing protein [Desulfobacterales bacterium]
MEGDNVALLIDWENIKICATEKLNAPPDIILLKKVARKYGRLTVARAYANWAD